ncbi:MAG: hypothetical protein ABI683_12875 [Ginsengibacter sp.]
MTANFKAMSFKSGCNECHHIGIIINYQNFGCRIFRISSWHLYKLAFLSNDVVQNVLLNALAATLVSSLFT